MDSVQLLCKVKKSSLKPMIPKNWVTTPQRTLSLKQFKLHLPN